ncbi:MAG: response regulator [Fibrobacteria bacterium]|nr:response regulator [Fibrobacteria bacterium]
MQKILVVDDEPVIQSMLQDFLESIYDVTVCANGDSALQQVKLHFFDLVISDINMPGMKGYELLSRIKTISPETKTVLITAYNVDEYIRLARTHGICNIISKTAPFNFKELEMLVKGLISGDVFGIEKHLGKGYQVLGAFVIKNSNEAKNVRSKALKLIPPLPRDENEIKLVFDEIITNAIYHSPMLESGQKKYEEYKYIELQKEEYIHVTIGQDEEKICISILDRQGNLDKDRVIFLIDRHVNAEGIFDESGRGIYMSRLFSDRIHINIDPGNMTEFIIMYYRNPNAFKGYKPLYINQL